MAFGRGELLLLPDMVEEALDATIVEPGRRAAIARFAPDVHGTGPAFGCTVLGERIQGIRPIVPVDEIEVRIAGMIGDCAPVLRMLHPMDHRPVTAGRLAEATTMFATRQGAELAIHE